MSSPRQPATPQRHSWRPPLWFAFALALVFGGLTVFAAFSGANHGAITALAALFALCWRTAYTDQPA